MKRVSVCLVACAFVYSIASSAFGATIYNNLTPNNMMGIATRPDSPGVFEIEGADDFFLNSQTLITSATIVGLIVPGGAGTPTISDIVAEMYRIFPLDSNTVRTPNVPTRVNSPSDVAFDSRDSGAGRLTFTTSVIAPTFTVLNTRAARGDPPKSPPNHRGQRRADWPGSADYYDVPYAFQSGGRSFILCAADCAN